MRLAVSRSLWEKFTVLRGFLDGETLLCNLVDYRIYSYCEYWFKILQMQLVISHLFCTDFL